jgi:leader peptidase (prepilin peptidase) / N-methyltransferase
MTNAAALVTAGVAGLALGSFAVTAGLRTSRGDSVLAGRSRCDTCGRSLNFAQTTPVIAFVALRGACARCGARIDPVHLAGEVAGALVVAASLLAGDPWRTALLAALGLVLIAAAAVDVRTMRLPDLMTGAAAVLGLALAVQAGVGALLAGLAAAAVSVSLLLGLRLLAARRSGGEPGLGLGDVKLIGALALWLGALTPMAVAVAAVFGLAVVAVRRSGDRRLPFGPAIAAGAWIVGIGGEAGLWPTMM